MDPQSFATKQDIKRLFLRNRKKHLRLFCFIFACLLLFHLRSPPLYEAEATFRTSSRSEEQSELLRSFLQNSRVSSFKEGGAQSVLESRTLLRRVAEEVGLLFREMPSFPLFDRFLTAKDRLCADFGWKIPDRRTLVFSHVHTDSSEPFRFFLRFREEGGFEIYDEQKRKEGEGVVGAPAFFRGHRFTLEEARSVVTNKSYQVQVLPWVETVKGIRSKLKIKQSKSEKNIFFLTFSHPRPEIASRLLNGLMSGYREHLKSENEEMAVVQMDYLEKRQAQLVDQYEQSLQEHKIFLEESLKESGFIGFKQEVDCLERPGEEYLRKLHEVDLQMGRLKKYAVPSPLRIGQPTFADYKTDPYPEIEGMGPETAEKICLEYNKQQDELRLKIRHLRCLIGKVFDPDFSVTSLTEFLTDGVSRDLIEQAAHISLRLEDRDNHGPEDLERMENSLAVQKRFFVQHLRRLLEMERLRSNLLEEKIVSLRRTSLHLLREEKMLLSDRLGTVRRNMERLPEKWKRENRLGMQKDLSVAMLEGLAQLTESKNVQHRLFYVESKAIDPAYSPPKAKKGFILIQSALIGALFCLFLLIRDVTAWLSEGVALTARSAGRFGVAFCGFYPKRRTRSTSETLKEEQETLHRIGNFVTSHSSEGRGTTVCFLSSSSDLLSRIGSLLRIRGSKVLTIDCTPVRDRLEPGLYDYLSSRIPDPIRISEEGPDRIEPGMWREDVVELLFRKEFVDFIEETRKKYDFVLLSFNKEVSEAAVHALTRVCLGLVIHDDDVFYEEEKRKVPLAVVLTNS